VSLGCVLRPPWRLQNASLGDAPTPKPNLIDSTYFYFVLHGRSSGLAL